MKKIFCLSVFILVMCIILNAQDEKIFPIPSFNVPVDSSSVRFQENNRNDNVENSRQKRQINVKIIGNGPIVQNCQCQVWVYSLDGLDILGPYTVLCGSTLVVEIDEREWGVTIQSTSSVLADVWIE